MSDDKNQRSAADRDRVNVHEDYEVRYWREKFGCSKDELEKAVQAVGPMKKDVETYLQERRA